MATPTCPMCGKHLATSEEAESDDLYGDVCDGLLTLGPDPYLSEIYDDETEVEMCMGRRYDRREDV